MIISKQLSHKIECPYCHLSYVKRDGCTIKGAQRFYCYSCQRYWQDGYIRVSKAFREQKELFDWAQMHPVLMNHLLTIADNLNRWHKKAEYPSKAQSCDVLLAYPMNSYHGLWIKLKKTQKPKIDLYEVDQPWVQALQAVGYEVKIAYGWRQAAQEIAAYLAWQC